MAVFDLAPALTADDLRTADELVGRPIRVEQWNYEASLDSVRHYAMGLGDDNPLFCNEEYGAASPYGTILAPPTFVLTAFDGAIGAGLPGVQPFYAGATFNFERRVPRGTRLNVDAKFGDVRHVSGSVAKQMIIQNADVTYTDGDDNVIANVVARTFRVPRRQADDGLAYSERGEHIYTQDELDDIMAQAITEPRRGARALDDVKVGDRLPAVVKGPLGRIDMTAYYAGLPGSPGYKSCELAWKYRNAARVGSDILPTNYDPSYFGERVLPSIGHQDPEAARELGMPGAYNNGPQRCGWFSHCITNWMGDGAFLRHLDVRLNRPEIFGDTIWIDGEVVAVDTSGIPTMSLDLAAHNQLGEQTASARARVEWDGYGRAR